MEVASFVVLEAIAERTLMGKYSSGVSIQDCEGMMRAIQAVHSAHVVVTLLPFGTGFAGGVTTRLECRFDVLPGSSLPDVISVENEFPCNEHTEFLDHLFAGLYALDFEIQRTYENSKLWQE